MGFAQSENQDKVELPDAVLKAFKSAYPNAEILGFEAEKNDNAMVYEIECKFGKVEKDILYSADGSIIQIEQEIAVSALPEIVAKAIGSAYPDGKIDEADMISRDSIIEYEVAVEVGEEKFEAVVSSDGKIIASAQIAADEDDDADDEKDDDGDDDEGDEEDDD
ncbi:MAG: PepSY-like domain-containing protein [Candidatus Zixiibacteriota bacterium]